MSPAPTSRRYRIAGLVVRSAFILQGAPTDTTQDADDLVIEDGRARGPAPDGARHATSADGRRVRLVAPDGGRFLVEDGARVTAWPADGFDAGTLAQWLMGPVLAVASLQRDRLVLHGATVQIGPAAIIVIGHSGVGKSTIAAACAARGHAVLADDITVIDDAATGWPQLHAHAPLVRLHEAPEVLPVMARWAASDKQAFALPAAAPGSPEIAAIVSVADGDAGLERLSAAAAAFALVTYSFCQPILTGAQRAANLRQCAHVASRVPVWRVTRPRDLSAVQEVVRVLETLVGDLSHARLPRTPLDEEIR